MKKTEGKGRAIGRVEITGQGGSASKLFTNIDKEIPPGPPDIPKLIDVLKQCGVSVAA